MLVKSLELTTKIQGLFLILASGILTALKDYSQSA
jgi:hypothetical protein